jgi:hypothetical protein
MNTEYSLPERIEVKPGGLAQYFIYLVLIIVLGSVNAVVKIPAPYVYYVYMIAGVSVVIGMNSIQGLVFRRPVIVATKEGLWTKRLKQLKWSEIKEIRTEKTNRFSFVGDRLTQNTDVDLIIETRDGRDVTYWGAFLNTDIEQLSATLNSYLHQSN